MEGRPVLPFLRELLVKTEDIEFYFSDMSRFVQEGRVTDFVADRWCLHAHLDGFWTAQPIFTYEFQVTERYCFCLQK